MSLEDVERQLWEGYGERPTKELLSDGNQLFLLFEDRDGTSWTLLLLIPDQTSPVACVNGTGTYWQNIKWAVPLQKGPET